MNEPRGEAPEAIELGELSQLGRVATAHAVTDDAAEYVPVASKYSGLYDEHAPIGEQGGGSSLDGLLQQHCERDGDRNVRREAHDGQDGGQAVA